MKALLRLTLFLLPTDWRQVIRSLRDLGVVKLRAFFGVIGLNLLRVMTEAFGIVMILPILQYIEMRGDYTTLAADSRFWRALLAVYGAIGISIDLMTLSGAVFLLITLRQVIGYVSAVETIRLKEDVGRRLSTNLFHLMMSARGQYLQGLGTGNFVTVIGQHCGAAAAVVNNLMMILATYVTFLTYGGVLLVAAPIPTLATAVFGIVVALAMRPFTEQAKLLSLKRVQLSQDFTQFLAERYHAWRLVKLSQSQASEDRAAAQWADRTASIALQTAATGAKLQLYVTPLTVLFALAGLILAVNVLGLGLSEVTLFVVVVSRLSPALDSFLRTRQALASYSASLQRVEVTRREAQAASEPNSGTLPFTGLQHALSFSRVTVTYPGATEPALSELTFTIPAHKLTAITGPSGAGKSTLVDLIPRILEPSSGQITIDGTPLAAFDLAALRARMAFVTQQPLLFDDTVAANVRYTRPDATTDEVIEACRMAHAEEFITRLPGGYESRLGEGGAILSGGQRQRLVLARTFLARANVLILDEATSALDHESEDVVQRAVDEIRARGDMTIIVIAHRLSTIRNADHLLVLKQGGLIEQGRPTDLHGADSWYTAALRHSEHLKVLP
jgi:ATP-binding cassette, subfamily B, bacterial MsbA